MGTFVTRRLLLMIPTLVGITMVVFLLMAMSPGGIAASLGERAAEAPNGSALARAYFEDRYGLDDPVLFQYARWLARVSPLKFGEQGRVLPTGEVVRIPRLPPRPPCWEWWDSQTRAEASPGAPSTPPDLASLAAEEAGARAALLAAIARLRGSLLEYASGAGIRDVLTSSGTLDVTALAARAPDRGLPQWPAVRQRGEEAARAYSAAVLRREALVRAVAGSPLPRVGVSPIPGVVSFGPPDLGRSIHGQPVSTLIARALPATLLLNLLAFPIIYTLAIPSGILAAGKPGRAFDRASGVVVLSLWSIPTIWAGTMALGFLASRERLGWFPVSGLHSAAAASMPFLPRWQGGFEPGWLLDTLWHAALPVLCLAYTGLAMLTKQTRAAMLESLHADYIRTARAKGVGEWDVLLRHAWRNSLLPLITMLVQVFPAMLAGSVVVERIFSIPGMGTLILNAIQERDREVILAVTVVIGVANAGALLLADVLYAFADPRVRYR